MTTTLVLLTSLACDLEPVLRRHLRTPYELIALPDSATDAEIAAAMQRADAVLTLRYDKAPAPHRGCASCRSPAPVTTGST
ncbi:MAG: hypothetical protein WDO24_28550 [Pseudomonadota bacterium]